MSIYSKLMALSNGANRMIDLSQQTLSIGAAQLNGTSLGYITVKSAASISSPYTLTLPSAQGSAGSILTNDGSGNLSWGSASIATGNLTEATSSILTITGGTNAVVGSGTSIQVKQSSGSQSGFLSSTDWTTFNNKQTSLTLGDVIETVSSILFISGGTAAVVGSGLSIQVQLATTTNSGYLSSTDWNTFNSKQSALTIGSFSESTSSVLTITGGTNSIIGSGLSVEVKRATTTQSGYLSSTDWNTFNNKASSLGYTPAHSGANSDITSLSGLTTALSIAQGGTNSSTALTSGKIMVSSAGAIVESTTNSSALSNLDATSSIQTQLNAKLELAGGTMSGNIAMGSNKITGLANGTSTNDAVNYGQVSSLVAGLNYDPNGPALVPNIIDDSLMTPPGSPVNGASYIAASGASGGWTAGHVYEYNLVSLSWVDVLGRAIIIGDRFGVNFEVLALTPAGGFASKAAKIATVTNATPGSYTYTFTAPTTNLALYINGENAQDIAHLYYYNSVWIDLLGGATVRPKDGAALSYNGNILNVGYDNSTVGLTANQLAIKAGGITDTHINASASIAYSKLNLSNTIVNADISSSAAIAYSKLNLSTSILNADISSSAAIAYSKLNLATSIVNADISTSAAIALSKLATLSTGKVLQSNASTGVIEASSVTTTTLGFLDATSSIQTQINAKVSNSLYNATGSLVYASGVNTPASLAAGTTGYILTMGATVPQWSPAPSTGANTTLSNLGTTAINTGLIPASSVTYDLGSLASTWRNAYLTSAYLTSTYFNSGAYSTQLTSAYPLTANTAFILPNNNGTSGQVLATDGSGNTSWSNVVTPSAFLNPDQESTYAFYARSDFGADGSLFFNSVSGSATNQIATSQNIKFTSNTGIFNSGNLIGNQLRTEAVMINRASVRLLYENGYTETPTLSISRDGGNTFSTITDSLLTTKGNLVVGDYSWSSGDTLSSGTVSTIQTGINGVGAVITPAYDQVISAFDFYLKTAASSGTVTAYLYLSSAGTITGSPLATASETKTLGTDITSTAAFCRFTFPNNYTLLASNSYIIVVRNSVAGANTDLVAYTTTSSASWNVSGLTWNGTTSNTYTTNSLKYLTNIYSSGVDLRIKVQSSGTYTGNTSAESHLKGFGVDFVWQGNMPLVGDSKFETRIITSTEASTGLITLQGVSFTPGTAQLKVYSNGHAFSSTQFTELSSNQVQFPANSFVAGDLVRFEASYGMVDGSSISLGKLNLIYDAIVGSSAQVSAGLANYSSLNTAISLVASGGEITLISGVTENVTLNKQLTITGKGYNTGITGSLTVTSAAARSMIDNLSVTSSITFQAGADKCFGRMWQVTGQTFSNDVSNTSNVITVIVG